MVDSLISYDWFTTTNSRLSLLLTTNVVAAAITEIAIIGDAGINVNFAASILVDSCHHQDYCYDLHW